MDADNQLLHRARLLQAGEIAPAVPRAAATVALIRDACGQSARADAAGGAGRTAGIEVYLLRRVPKMAFAAGMYVFPGGSVDPADAGPVSVDWAGPAAADWAARLDTSPEAATALVRAAVRETFEEAGVLLADPVDAPGTVPPQLSEVERAQLEAGGTSLSGLLARHRLRLRSDLLAALQHWITPETEPRRYDTWFFVAALPQGQNPRPAGTEADRRVWVSPDEALAAGLTLMAPTRAALSELARYRTVAEALAAERVIRAVTPRFEVIGERVAFFND